MNIRHEEEDRDRRERFRWLAGKVANLTIRFRVLDECSVNERESTYLLWIVIIFASRVQAAYSRTCFNKAGTLYGEREDINGGSNIFRGERGTQVRSAGEENRQGDDRILRGTEKMIGNLTQATRKVWTLRNNNGVMIIILINFPYYTITQYVCAESSIYNSKK